MSSHTVEETVPAVLQPEVDAALTWFNEQQDITFKVTGIIDAEAAIQQTGGRQLRLILCGGDRCEQHTFLALSRSDGVDVRFADVQEGLDKSSYANDARLDPPPGALRNWVERTLAQNSFTLIIFYRGLW